MRTLTAVTASVLAFGCAGDPMGGDTFPAPIIDDAAVSPIEHNALGALVRVRVRHADSVAVLHFLAGAAASSGEWTPAVPATGDSVAVPVLGLAEERRYTLRVIANGPGGTVASDPLELTTGPLPEDLPAYVAGGTDPTPGFVAFALARYGVVIDNTGRVVWYRAFPHGPGLTFIAQPNNRYVARPSTPDPTDAEQWIEFDILGNETRRFGCARGLQARFHDVMVEPDGGFWILCDETRVLDLTPSGGVADARVTGTGVQHISADGAVLFDWSPFDHFEIADVEPAERTGGIVNWTHGNSFDFTADGNIVVSFRNLGEITKIDTRTGAVLWRMGGRRNEFTFPGATEPAFSRQHSARAPEAGVILMLDNAGDPNESRAERYEVDEAARTARLERSFGADPAAFTPIGGSVQALPGGRTLVSFGTAGRVEEYDAEGRIVWRIEGGAGYVFRAQRIGSLYTPGAGRAH